MPRRSGKAGFSRGNRRGCVGHASVESEAGKDRAMNVFKFPLMKAARIRRRFTTDHTDEKSVFGI
jgi:hypothetical protein